MGRSRVEADTGHFEEAVLHTDNAAVAKALENELVHPQIRACFPVVLERQARIEGYGTRVRYEWTARTEPQMLAVHRLARKARRRR